GDLRGSQKLLHHALSIVRKLAPEGRVMSQVLNNLGILAERRGELIQAETYLHRALEIEQQLGSGSFEIADRFADLGELSIKRGDLANAEKYYRSALAIQERVCPGTKLFAETMAALGRIYSQENDSGRAAYFFKKALAALDSQTSRLGGSQTTRSDFRAQYTTFYRDYIEILVSRHEPDLAFHMLERSRARSLLEMLSTAHVDLHSGAAPELLEREHSLRSDINAKSEHRIRLMGGATFRRDAESSRKGHRRSSHPAPGSGGANSLPQPRLCRPHPAATAHRQRSPDATAR